MRTDGRLTFTSRRVYCYLTRTTMQLHFWRHLTLKIFALAITTCLASCASNAASTDNADTLAYIGQLKAVATAPVHYPTGRQAAIERPAGTVRVQFALRRDGSVLTAEVAKSSNSTILDNFAIGLIRRTHFPPFPDDAWPNEGQHFFTVDLDFLASKDS